MHQHHDTPRTLRFRAFSFGADFGGRSTGASRHDGSPELVPKLKGFQNSESASHGTGAHF